MKASKRVKTKQTASGSESGEGSLGQESLQRFYDAQAYVSEKQKQIAAVYKARPGLRKTRGKYTISGDVSNPATIRISRVNKV